jgi:hypothetical protein
MSTRRKRGLRRNHAGHAVARVAHSAVREFTMVAPSQGEVPAIRDQNSTYTVRL